MGVDATEEEQEIRAWKCEARNYLLHDVHHSVDHAYKELEKMDFLWGKIRLSRAVASPTIKADVRMEGHLVVGATIELKMTKVSRNHPVNGALQQYCVLSQILEFHNIVQTQMKRLASLNDFLSHQQIELDRDDAFDVGVHLDIVQTTFQSLQRICRELRDAANVLRLPSRRRFPYCSHIDHSFKPIFPPEVIIDFSVHRGELLIEVFIVAATQKHPTEIPDGCASKKELTGAVCIFRGQRVEIMDYTSISVPIPQLEETLGLIDDQIAWLAHVRDNIQALADCHA